jgi:hypothetical protein
MLVHRRFTKCRNIIILVKKIGLEQFLKVAKLDDLWILSGIWFQRVGG